MKTVSFITFISIFSSQLMNAMSSSQVNAGESSVNRRDMPELITEGCHRITSRTCPDAEVRFYLFTRSNIDEKQLIHIDDTLDTTNLSSSFFNPKLPSKIIIHGFRADMFLTPLFRMKTEYLQRDSYNIFFVDWFNLSSSFCYPAVVHNIKHVGACTAQLVNRIRDSGGGDKVHVIGFSLGAQVANWLSNSLKPDYLLPRITGLDPALPLFVTANKIHKLDSSDARFVDVFHCNGLMQGQIERCGHIDFYMNGGVYQPGCASNGNNILSCSHHRCPNYFMESIQSSVGFYGWKCQSYFYYVLGFCPFNDKDLMLAGEDCKLSSRGLFLVDTNSESPFAKGRFPDNVGEPRTQRLNDDESKSLLGNLKRIRKYLDKFPQDWSVLEGSTSNNTFEKSSDHSQFAPEVILVDKG